MTMDLLIEIYLQNPVMIYAWIGLVTFFSMIQGWKRKNDYNGLAGIMRTLFFWGFFCWPFVVTLWVLSWPVFSLKFWLRDISFRWVRGVNLRPWEFDL
jgi:hypothetical protein